MKHLFLSLISVAAISTLFSCGNNKSYTLHADIDNDTLNGSEVVLINYDNGDTLATTTIVNNTVILNGDVENPIIARLLLPGQKITFVLEPGDIAIDTRTGDATGTALNQKLNDFAASIDSLENATREALADTTLTDAQREAIMIDYDAKAGDAYNALYSLNKENPIGYYAFLQITYGMSTAQLDSMLNLAPANYRDYTRVQRWIESAQKQESTGEGQPFTDFNVTYNDSTYSFSEYIGNGTPTIVDFWASWCGPCRREIPNIKAISQKYAGKLNVLGVAVWDKPEDTERAINELEIPWQQIINAQTIPTDIYGITGIPHIMIIDGDGTILSRGLQGEELAAKVDEIMAR